MCRNITGKWETQTCQKFRKVHGRNLDVVSERGKKVKQPKKLTRDLKQAVKAYGLNANNRMLLKDCDTYVTIIHKQTGNKKIIDKYAR